MKLHFAPAGVAVRHVTGMVAAAASAVSAARVKPSLPQGLVSQPKNVRAEDAAGPAVPHSATLTGLEFRVTRLHVKDNGTEWVWPFIRYSDLYVLAFVQSSFDKKPVGVTLDGFEDVDDDDQVPLDYAPYSRVFGKGDRFPDALHCYLSVVKSNKGIRDFGAALTKTLKSRDYREATSALTKVIAKTASTAASASSGTLLSAVAQVAQVLGNILAGVADRVLSRHIVSYTAVNGDFDQIGRRDMTWEDKHCVVDHRLTVRGLSSRA